MFDILLIAFILSLVLVGIHSYFGLEIIKRGIIFTDLAVGQMSALGSSLAMIFFDGKFYYLTSLCFAILGGALISSVAKKEKNSEAFIGLLYAFGVSSVFIILSKSAHGMEEFQKLIAADILFTPVNEVIKTGIIYILLGISMFFLKRVIPEKYKDFFFFVAFAATVTSSVKIAGVLVVFSLLISPALISITLGNTFNLYGAWIIGTITCFAGIALSYFFDLPTGYSIVFTNSLPALAVFFLPALKVKKSKTSGV